MSASIIPLISRIRSRQSGFGWSRLIGVIGRRTRAYEVISWRPARNRIGHRLLKSAVTHKNHDSAACRAGAAGSVTRNEALP